MAYREQKKWAPALDIRWKGEAHPPQWCVGKFYTTRMPLFSQRKQGYVVQAMLDIRAMMSEYFTEMHIQGPGELLTH